MAGLYLLQHDNRLVEFVEAPYDSEALLQELLQRHPGLLAGELVDSTRPRRWLLVKREAGVPDGNDAGNRWSIDHLYLDQDGIPTLVEVKRSTDTRIRREVVGQMLDYAANSVVYWSVEVIREQYQQTHLALGDGDSKLSDFLEGADPEEFWTKVKSNLQAGKIRMLFVADRIPKELRRIVEFLNVQMDPAEVLALEIRQYVGENLKTFVPSIIGQTSEAEIRKTASRSSRIWDEATFFELLRQKDSKAEANTRKLLEWAYTHSSVEWGSGQQTGSFVPMIESPTKPQALFAMYTGGTLELYFRFLATKPPFIDPAKLDEAVARVNSALPKLLIDDAAHKKPNVRLSDLSEQQFEQLLNALEWMATTIRSK
ncbi:hypothetical protein [Caballeronia mineralivorans]|uniref:hypothetical protein n=1 Tax=Caballeronia mineralivorans TaxID=2010198 RepID=UPI0023F3DB38|nr:hypothetical protein [Caballeronia mineralivorans]MDB5784164.1 hypothetical protein [Caballeronia mineralivorans]